MLLTISTTHRPATDLGYLLHKNPAKVQVFETAAGVAHVFYPRAEEDLCEVALLLEVDPVRLVRGSGRGEGALDQYVNDRPYAASSLLSVAISSVFGTAMGGRCKEREELAKTALPLRARVGAIACSGGEEVLRRLFEPLGYQVAVTGQALDEKLYGDEASEVCTVELSATCLLRDLLTHLYVLIPVADNEKHYWVGDEEVEKLLRHGEGWLASHPERELIASRYLKRRKPLIERAMERLREDEPEKEDEPTDPREEAVERTLSLHEQRHGTVLAVLRGAGAASVVDLGCGDGRLLSVLVKEPQFTRIVGMDVSHVLLERAADRLHLDRASERQRERLQLIHGSLLYRDKRLEGFDAAAVVEVIEHLDEPRLKAFERVVFECARPRVVVVTTPNREYNVMWETLEAGTMRHRDHRFEWTRAEFEAWTKSVCTRFGYSCEVRGVGPEEAAVGAPSQMGVFRRE
jgi:3' terminal RNA ribose 2'-O-methyltransferase Hen1